MFQRPQFYPYTITGWRPDGLPEIKRELFPNNPQLVTLVYDILLATKPVAEQLRALPLRKQVPYSEIAKMFSFFQDAFVKNQDDYQVVSGCIETAYLINVFSREIFKIRTIMHEISPLAKPDPKNSAGFQSTHLNFASKNYSIFPQDRQVNWQCHFICSAMTDNSVVLAMDHTLRHPIKLEQWIFQFNAPLSLMSSEYVVHKDTTLRATYPSLYGRCTSEYHHRVVMRLESLSPQPIVISNNDSLETTQPDLSESPSFVWNKSFAEFCRQHCQWDFMPSEKTYNLCYFEDLARALGRAQRRHIGEPDFESRHL